MHHRSWKNKIMGYNILSKSSRRIQQILTCLVKDGEATYAKKKRNTHTYTHTNIYTCIQQKIKIALFLLLFILEYGWALFYIN